MLGRLVAFLALSLAPLMLGVTTTPQWPVNQPIGFRTEMSQLHASSAPYTGALVVKINDEGIFNGVYQSDSIRPDPFYGQQIPVTGSLSGNNVRIQIGSGPKAVTINGTYTANEISGSVTSGLRGGIWVFKGTRVHLKKPPQNT